MRIGFDVTPLCVRQSGVGTYTRNLLEHLDEYPYDVVTPLAHRAPDAMRPLGVPAESRRNGATRVQAVAPRGINKTIWMQMVLPLWLSRSDVDVCHFTNNVAPLWTPVPSVVTIHDMTVWLYPEYHYHRRLWAMRPFVPPAARRAAAIIAVSHSAKRDIVRILDVPEEKVHVIYEAPAAPFRPITAGDARAILRRQGLSVPDRFILYVGTIEPRKNLVRLMQAFATLRLHGGISHDLVLVGQRGWKDRPVFEAVERLGLQNSVHFLGHVSTPTLVALYNLAEALVFPSLYEGFGLPVVEAMACGTPVLTSSKGALGEIAGDAAEFVEPAEVESIAAGLRRLLTNEVRRTELRARGFEHVAGFDWATAAAATRRVYADTYHLERAKCHSEV